MLDLVGIQQRNRGSGGTDCGEIERNHHSGEKNSEVESRGKGRPSCRETKGDEDEV